MGKYLRRRFLRSKQQNPGGGRCKTNTLLFLKNPCSTSRKPKSGWAGSYKQNSYKFGSMSHGEWDHQDEEKKYLWCNAFRKHFGNSIDQYAIRYNIPKQLLAGVIANEMLDWKFPDGTWFDGITGGGVGYAQIALKTARMHGVTGSDTEIKHRLNSYEGSVEIAAKILKDYFYEFRDSIEKINWEQDSESRSCIICQLRVY